MSRASTFQGREHERVAKPNPNEPERQHSANLESRESGTLVEAA